MKQDESDYVGFRRRLLDWWDQGGKRQFSWRVSENRTSYGTLVAETMLRRTRAEQVEQVYVAFLRRYPSIEDAMDADDAEILEMMKPLGLRWRADGFIELLRFFRDSGRSALPSTVEDLRTLPGVGDYVSNSVACFAGNDIAATLIDVNVVRVLGRVFGLDTRGEARRRKEVRELASRAVDRDRSADYHYAIIDFAAHVCRARRPMCGSCPLRSGCAYVKVMTG